MKATSKFAALLVCSIFFLTPTISQNVGIGVTNPLQKLHVDGTIRLNALAGVGNRMMVVNANGDMVSLALPPSGVTAGAGLSGGGTVGALTLNILANNGLNVDPAADHIQLGGALIETTVFNHGSYAMIHNLDGAGDFMIQDLGVNRFAVLDNGRTTVGGIANRGQFNVTGNSYYSDDLWLRDGSITSGDYLIRLYDSSDDGVIDLYQNNSVKNRIHANGNSFITGGRLGVGTINPTAPLDVAAITGLKTVNIKLETNNASSITHGTDILNEAKISNAQLVGTRISANSTNAFPTFSTVGADISAEGFGLRKFGAQVVASCSGANNYAYGVYSVLSNTAAGSGAQYAGYFAGNVYSTGSYLPSFRALKQNIELASPAISKLMQLEVKSYEYRNAEFEAMNLPKGKQIGFMADEIKSVYPGLVTKAIQPAQQNDAKGRDIEFEAVNYTGLIPDLVKGTQEQQEEIESLKAQNTQLKTALHLLTERIEKLEEKD